MAPGKTDPRAPAPAEESTLLYVVRRSRLFPWIAVAVCIALGGSARAQAPPPPRALLLQYCATCHNDSLRTASISFQSLDPPGRGTDAVWEKALRKLTDGEMPPPGRPRPDAAAIESLAQWIEAPLDKAAADHPRLGGTPIHRLNRAEYANVIRDLLGVSIDAESMLPADDTAYGFDNIASALGVSSTSLERYMAAASRITSQIGDLAAKGQASRVFVCHPKASADEMPCARFIFSLLARRAYRRAVSNADLDPLMALYRDGRGEGGFNQGILRGVEAILISPSFLFRVERPPAGVVPGSAYRIGNFELASRLSFFLWSTMPDDQLLDLAEKGRLSDDSVLDGQIRRMLADNRSNELIRNFSGQWLYLRNLRHDPPDSGDFPRFNDALAIAFLSETELFFESILRENRSVLDLLGANYTFLNDRLAAYYGIPGVEGADLRRVMLTNPQRGGLLGQGSVLTVTSYANRTSVTRRGQWILNNILGSPPPPPPPNVPSLRSTAADGHALKTLRQQMEAHRADPVCASCHLRMDSLGFVLEHYDAAGAWRDTDSGTSIDAKVTLPDGTSLEGLEGLRTWLLAHPNQFVRTLTEKLLTYALGRGLEYYDEPSVREIDRKAAADGNRLPALLAAIVKSRPFLMTTAPQRGDLR
jgi:cytochrome c553